MKSYLVGAWVCLCAFACLLAVMGACDTADKPADVRTVEAGTHVPLSILQRSRGRVGAPNHPIIEDTRTPEQISQAACTRADGTWACASQRPKTFGASSLRSCPACTVPQWYLDGGASLACASDGNTGTSSTCGANGVGPLLTFNEIVARWGTLTPTLPQSTTVTELSSETVGQEYVAIQPILGPGVVFSVLGTPKLVATFALGTVTAKNRATPALLSSTGFSAAGLAVGQMVVNTTRANSEAKIYALSGSTATLTQPLSPITNTSASTEPGSMPSEVDTWASTDSVSVYSLPILNVEVVAPQGGQLNGSFAGGVLWMQWLTIPDTSGTGGSSLLSLQVGYGVTPWIVDVNFQTGMLSTSLNSSGSFSQFFINSLYNLFGMQCGTVIGGGNLSFVTAIGQNAGIDGDMISQGVFVFGTPTFAGLVYVGTNGLTIDSGQFRIDANWFSSAVVWGPGAVHVNNGGAIENDTGGVWHNACWLITGACALEGATTGTSYSAGTWTDGRTLTAANFDTYGTIQSSKMTGAKFFTQ